MTAIALMLLLAIAAGGTAKADVVGTVPSVSVSTSCNMHSNDQYQMGVKNRVCTGSAAFALIRFNDPGLSTHYRACLDVFHPKPSGKGSQRTDHICTSVPQLAEAGTIYANKIKTGGPGPTTYVLTFTSSQTGQQLGVVTITKPAKHPGH